MKGLLTPYDKNTVYTCTVRSTQRVFIILSIEYTVYITNVRPCQCLFVNKLPNKRGCTLINIVPYFDSGETLLILN